MNQKLLFLIKLIVSISIFSILVIKIGPVNIYQSFIEIKIFSLLSIPLIILLHLIGALNLKILLNSIKTIKFSRIFKPAILGWSLGIFTPGKLGELSTAYFISKRENIPLGKSTSILLIDKIITFTYSSILSLIGVYLFLTKEFFLLSLVFLILVFLALVITFFTKLPKNIIKKLLPKKYSNTLSGFSTTLPHLLKKEKHLIFLNILITFLKLFVSAYITKIVFLALGYNIPIVFLILINSAVAIGSLIPISLNGIGITDAIYVFLLGTLGINAIAVMAHNIFILATSYITALIVALTIKSYR